MMVPHSAKEAKALLGSYGLSPRKKFGQNFLTDESLLSDIAEIAGVNKSDTVLEIGPGLGTLTAVLADRAGEVVSLEIDKGLIPVLNDVLSEYENVSIVNADVMKVSVTEVLGDRSHLKIVANLPYYITTPILMKLLEEDIPFESITVMVQKEVAERMCQGPGSRDYGALSLAVQYYTRPEIMLIVPPESFTPPPAVDSAVIRLTRLDEAPVDAPADKLFAVIRAAFNQRRKTLVNSLAGGGICSGDKTVIAEAMSDVGLESNVRAEQLSLEQFSELAKKIYS